MARRADGGFDVLLPASEREQLAELLADLADQLDESPDAEAFRRLHPPAYLDDDDADAAYQLLAGEELRTSRREAFTTVIDSLGRARLTEAEAWAWIRALNAVRLAVGTVLDVSEDEDPDLDELDDEHRAMWGLYEFTTLLQHDVVRALGT